MTTTATSPEEVIAARQKELDALPDGADLIRRGEALQAHRAELSARVHAARRATSALQQFDSEIATDAAWQTFLVAAREALCIELLTTVPRARDKAEIGRQRNLELSIRTVDVGVGVLRDTGWTLGALKLGELMREAGFVAAVPIGGQVSGEMPWYGTLREVDQRIATLEQRRAEAQAQLADALLDDEERVKLAEKRATIAAARNAMPTRKVRGDGSVFLKYPDGHVEEVDPSAAFRRMRADGSLYDEFPDGRIEEVTTS